MKTTPVLFVIGFILIFSIFPASADELAADVKAVDQFTIKGPKSFYNGYEPGDNDGNINVIIEIPKGSTQKWEVSKENGTIFWELKNGKPREISYLGGYPANYGSIPKTTMPKKYGGDGDPIDIVVIGDSIPRGSVVQVKLIGVLNIKEGDDYDGKLIGVRKGSPEYVSQNFADLNQKFNGIGDQVASWFISYKGQDAGLRLENIGSEKEAMDLLITAIKEYKE